MSVLSIDVNSPNFMTLPPEILGQILTAYALGDEVKICDMVKSLCSAAHCPTEAWDTVLTYVRSTLNKQTPQEQADALLTGLSNVQEPSPSSSTERKERWKKLEIPNPLPGNITSEMFIRHMCRIITACDDGYADGGVIHVTGSLLHSNFEFMIPFMIQRLKWRRGLMSPRLRNVVKTEDDMLKYGDSLEAIYTNCLPFKRGKRTGMFRGFGRTSDAYNEPDAPKTGIWTDDADGKQYGLTKINEQFYYTDDEWNVDDILLGRFRIPSVRLGDLKQRITSKQFEALNERLTWIQRMNYEYSCFFKNYENDDDDDDDDELPLKELPRVLNTRRMLILIKDLNFLHGTKPFVNFFIEAEEESDESEEEEFLETFFSRNATDAELMLLYIMLVEQVPFHG